MARALTGTCPLWQLPPSSPPTASAVEVINAAAKAMGKRLLKPVVLHVSTSDEAMAAWVSVVGRNGPKLYPARILFCYKKFPIEKILTLTKASSEVALHMATQRQARAGMNVAAEIEDGE